MKKQIVGDIKNLINYMRKKGRRVQEIITNIEYYEY